MYVEIFFSMETHIIHCDLLETSVLEDYYDEIELFGFPVTGTLFDLAKSDFRGDIFAEDFVNNEGKTIRIVGDFVAEKYVRTKMVM